MLFPRNSNRLIVSFIVEQDFRRYTLVEAWDRDNIPILCICI